MNWIAVIELVQSVLAWLQQMQNDGNFGEIESAIQAFIAEIETAQGQAVVTKVKALVPPAAPKA